MPLLQQIVWIDRRTVVIPPKLREPDQRYQLVYSKDAEGVPLDEKFQLPENLDLEMLTRMLKGELALVSVGSSFRTGVQTAGVLDELFYYDGKLGAEFHGASGGITIRLWAPTARVVKLLLFRDAGQALATETVAMVEMAGVWSAMIDDSWRRKYYLFSVAVYVPSLGEVVENVMSDPYSTDLALNGSKSRLTDLDEAWTKPEGWDSDASPMLRSWNDLTIWELHVRDFSVSDASVSEALRGTYLAFTQSDSNGMRHLKRLAGAGLKAVHLLPTFHIGSVDEDKRLWQRTGDLSGYAADSTEQQAAVAAIKDHDAFNWGYDPVHFMAVEGSYAVNADDRVKEYRQMVQALHRAGLRVIQDQVFNHTHNHGQAANSVLDKIVPGYYYRLDGDGNVMNATCCSDTASEHRMMEKLMVDALVQNVKQYKIDGFRFDLMGYHFVSNMQKIQAAVGPDVYLYGEGWGAGPTENRPGMPNATQYNLYGTGIGTFNDRMRDGIRGGNPFSDMQEQGFATGNPNNESAVDLLRLSLAGFMRDFSLGDGHSGASGYTASPIECINYCSCHDNQVLFDVVQLKAPAEEDTATRARRQVLALSLVAFSQGIPFFHAGDEMLRSKNMDHNSYNSGDWFNRMDFTYETNNWGTGLPMASENELSWAIMQPLLANPALRPTRADIVRTRDAFEALLRVRESSGLFRMATLDEVRSNLEFLESEAGVIVMLLRANSGSYSGYPKVLVVFNANGHETSVKTEQVKPHPDMPNCGSYDAEGGVVRVAGLTTAVFV